MDTLAPHPTLPAPISMEDALRAPSRGKQAHIIAVTSGKGGVGKTFVSANLAAALTRLGFKVLVLDADLGLANLDVVLNLYPKVTLHDVFTGKSSLQEAILPTPGGYSVLLDDAATRAYGVLGLTQPLRTIDAGKGYVMGSGLAMQAALVPLNGRWVCDGLIQEPVWLGPNYKRSYTESYTALRKAGGFSLGPG